MKCTCIALMACFFCLPSVSVAQKNTGVEKDKIYITPGIGVFSVYNAMRGSQYDDYNLAFPFISFSADIALTRHWTVGPYFAYTATSHAPIKGSYSFYFSGYEYQRYNRFQVGSKSEYHFHVGRIVNGYTGIALGYQRTKGTNPNERPQGGQMFIYTENPHHMFLNLFVGARARVSKHIAVFAETGTYVTFLNLGCSLKLK